MLSLDKSGKLPSWLKAQGENLFQEIKRVSLEAEKDGKKLIKLLSAPLKKMS